MLHLCKINNNILYPYVSFQNPDELAAYVAYHMSYENIIADQNLTGNDMKFCGYLCVATKEIEGMTIPICENTYRIRTTCLVDENRRILDIRNFEQLIARKSALTTTRSRSITAHNTRRQGKSHRKYTHYGHCLKVCETDPILKDFIPELRHANRVRQNSNTLPHNYKVETTENNWKSSKISRQYMWHKPRHKNVIQPIDMIDVIDTYEQLSA